MEKFLEKTFGNDLNAHCSSYTFKDLNQGGLCEHGCPELSSSAHSDQSWPLTAWTCQWAQCLLLSSFIKFHNKTDHTLKLWRKQKTIFLKLLSVLVPQCLNLNVPVFLLTKPFKNKNKTKSPLVSYQDNLKVLQM